MKKIRTALILLVVLAFISTLVGGVGNVYANPDSVTDTFDNTNYVSSANGLTIDTAAGQVELTCASFCLSPGDSNTTITISGDLVYCDNSGRMWTKTASSIYIWGPGYVLAGGSCVGLGSDYPACNYCDTLTYAGYPDWSLPPKDVLHQFGIDACGGYDYGCFPSWDPDRPTVSYWSSTEYSSYAAWFVYTAAGDGIYRTNKAANYAVRCNRGGGLSSCESSGILTSTNLLSGESVDSINYFGYNAPAIPTGTNLKVLFSQDSGPSKTWYGSSGTENAWDTLSEGDHLSGGSWVSLSTLNWPGENFYYKIMFESDGTATPVLEAVRVDYTSAVPAYTPEKTMVDDSSGSDIRGGVVSASTISSPTTNAAISEREWVVTGYNNVDFPTYSVLEGMYEVAGTISGLGDISAPGVYEWTGGTYEISSSPCGLVQTAVVFVNGDLSINSDFGGAVSGDPLGFKDGCSSSFAFIVSGDINIDGSVNNLYGIFYAGGTIDTVTDGTVSSNPLYIFGSIIAGGSPTAFSLDRNLGADNSTSPAEQIIYMPQYLITLKDLLGRPQVSWKEVR